MKLCKPSWFATFETSKFIIPVVLCFFSYFSILVWLKQNYSYDDDEWNPSNFSSIHLNYSLCQSISLKLKLNKKLGHLAVEICSFFLFIFNFSQRLRKKMSTIRKGVQETNCRRQNNIKRTMSCEVLPSYYECLKCHNTEKFNI